MTLSFASTPPGSELCKQTPIDVRPGLSDGHPFIFLFGNPTRSTGKFYPVCFGNEQDRWVHKAIDSRDCALPNKELIVEWIDADGEDSDFVRVRVRGLPPAADELQFNDRERIPEAQKREAQSLADDPLICGVDVSGGAAWNVIAFRRGGDARTLPRVRIPGEHTRDRSVLVGKLAEILRETRPARKVTAMFIDMAFGSPIYERLRALGFNNVFETNFGLTNTPGDWQAARSKEEPAGPHRGRWAGRVWRFTPPC